MCWLINEKCFIRDLLLTLDHWNTKISFLKNYLTKKEILDNSLYNIQNGLQNKQETDIVAEMVFGEGNYRF